MNKRMIFVAFAFAFLCCVFAQGQTMNPRYYDMGTPTVTDTWVDPVNGNDSNSGNTRGSAVATVNEAWNRIPQGTTLTMGRRIMLVAGNYTESNLPNYWEMRHGTFQFPIILQAADGQGTATFGGDINIFDCSYVYFIDFNIIPNPAGDAFHAEQCDHFLLHGMTLSGGNQIAQEAIKVNQSLHFYVEDCDISGGFDNAIDYVGVQYGHFQGNRIHNAGDWCHYAKGGSAYLRVESNEYYDCGTGGFTAGQGTGFEFMSSPWLHYEAYDIKFINNIIHDTNGAGFGVNGGYNILLAYNTLYRVGSISHVIEAVFGLRGCDGNTTQCNAYRTAGGWGPGVTGIEEPIPNRNVFIYNNIVYNPAPFQSQWQHFAIYGPRTPSAGTNIPDPAVTDTNLQIRGNVIWNGPGSHPLGIDDTDQGCQPSNPTCNATQLVAENTINTVQPQLIDPANGNFRPVEGGNVFTVTTYPIPDFPGGDRPFPPLAPGGNLANLINRDFDAANRPGTTPPGAYVSATTSCVLTCSASAPPSGAAGSPVPFSSTVSASNCAGAVVFDWNFDDGTAHGSQEDVSHIYASAGTYGWSYTAAVDSQNCNQNGSILISDVSYLFFDDFEDLDASDWFHKKGAWSVMNGDLTGTFSKKADNVAPFVGGCSNCTIDAYVRIQTAAARASVLGWYQDKRTLVELVLMDDKNKVVLKQRQNGLTVAKTKLARALDPGVEYHVQITYNGSTFQVFLDGALLFTMPSAALSAGGVAFRVKSTTGTPATASFEQIAVY